MTVIKAQYINIPKKTLDLISSQDASQKRVLPISKDEYSISVAVDQSPPWNFIDFLGQKFNKRIILVELEGSDLTQAIKLNYASNKNGLEKDTSKNTILTSKPAQFIQDIMTQAVGKKATDLHIEARQKNIRVRFRIDGNLEDEGCYNISTLPAIINYLKILAELNIAEKRMPQDGRISFEINREIYPCRISFVPSFYGESVAIRILPTRKALYDISSLGIDNTDLIKEWLASKSGMIVVTGPTGSGKTTTLYAFIQELLKLSRKVVSVENPIEYKIKNVSQVQVSKKVSFSAAVKSFLRQNPDSIFVGEIRDAETLTTAMNAALSGHLVVTTLHTKDSLSVFPRLINLGAKVEMIGAVLKGIVAQRLVRQLCPHCSETYNPTAAELDWLEIAAENNLTIKKEKGCDRCRNKGFAGRRGVFEIVNVSDNVRDIVLSTKGKVGDIRHQAVIDGMQTLKQNGACHVIQKYTSINELMRVLPTN